MASDFYDFGEALANLPAKEADKDDDRVVPYFETWEIDIWARKHGMPEIVFDWKRICDLTIIDEDKDWQKTSQAISWNKAGHKHRRWIVTCPNPNHDLHKTIVLDGVDYKSKGKCQMCITEEIDRIISLRAKRDREYEKQMQQLSDDGRRR